MRKDKLKTVTLREFAEEIGINHETLKIKKKLVGRIKSHCEENNISQRALARMVPGLTQDRVSRIFNGMVGGMTIDKLIQILSALKIKASLSLKKAA